MKFINLIFVDSKTARQLNRKYRQANYTPAVLTFYYGESEQTRLPDGQALGEIVICPAQAKKLGFNLKKLIDHGFHNFLSEIPSKKICGIGYDRDP